ncbi:ZIP family metal transporter [Flavobacteriaceae bacterium AU392]|nr:ZIP family metal transporter [Flavobacteriaceae bacterium]RKM85803.1 ZIP family metal transporter [Flavobacteriaceae bacterium AU392]
MNTYLLPIYAVLFGYVVVWITKERTIKNIKFLLAFSGAFLLSITVFELLPEVYSNLDAKATGLFIMLGILVQILLEFLSKGAEHGHMHIQKNGKVFPWLLFISLCVHSFLEGFPIHEDNDMVYGILVHKIPIAILVTTFLIQSGFKTVQIIGFLVLFAIMTPLGTILSHNISFLTNYISYFNAIVIGIFLHISTTILFESSEGHKFNLMKVLVISLAIACAYFI